MQVITATINYSPWANDRHITADRSRDFVFPGEPRKEREEVLGFHAEGAERRLAAESVIGAECALEEATGMPCRVVVSERDDDFYYMFCNDAVGILAGNRDSIIHQVNTIVAAIRIKAACV